ncbi:MAG: hypothetical protein HQM14_03465 [SAR324 cluster bacterium]|nr:hypothetical protein [SAR324 cluster bacterium]
MMHVLMLAALAGSVFWLLRISEDKNLLKTAVPLSVIGLCKVILPIAGLFIAAKSVSSGSSKTGMGDGSVSSKNTGEQYQVSDYVEVLLEILADAHDRHTVDYLVEKTGWKEKHVLLLLKQMLTGNLIEEDFDVESGIWFYNLVEADKSYLDVEQRLDMVV